jgi:hypothetical protein
MKLTTWSNGATFTVTFDNGTETVVKKAIFTKEKISELKKKVGDITIKIEEYNSSPTKIKASIISKLFKTLCDTFYKEKTTASNAIKKSIERNKDKVVEVEVKKKVKKEVNKINTKEQETKNTTIVLNLVGNSNEEMLKLLEIEKQKLLALKNDINQVKPPVNNGSSTRRGEH